jgi:hypothetical protein
MAWNTVVWRELAAACLAAADSPSSICRRLSRAHRQLPILVNEEIPIVAVIDDEKAFAERCADC